jgi:hypothetical protein
LQSASRLLAIVAEVAGTSRTLPTQHLLSPVRMNGFMANSHEFHELADEHLSECQHVKQQYSSDLGSFKKSLLETDPNSCLGSYGTEEHT